MFSWCGAEESYANLPPDFDELTPEKQVLAAIRAALVAQHGFERGVELYREIRAADGYRDEDRDSGSDGEDENEGRGEYGRRGHPKKPFRRRKRE